MNRAWIPAGALAGVSVAGLIALGHLTDSLGSKVSFPGTLTVDAPASPHSSSKPVAVKLDEGTVGVSNVTPAVSVRGGAASSATAPTVSGDTGQAGYRIPPSSSTTTHSTTANSPKVKPKKPPKRQTSIGADSGPNGDNGLAGGSSGSSTNTGATSGTPAPSAP